MSKEFDHLKKRTQLFAVNIIRLMRFLPKSEEGGIIKNQIIRSSTSVGANYRSACRARSKADFISKITIVEEEADETLYWLEMIELTGLMKADKLKELKQESEELTAIFTASGNTAKQNRK